MSIDFLMNCRILVAKFLFGSRVENGPVLDKLAKKQVEGHF